MKVGDYSYKIIKKGKSLFLEVSYKMNLPCLIPIIDIFLRLENLEDEN